jgi:acetyl esterase/lipase
MLNHELKRLSTKMPAATILISPWLDLSLNETAYSPGQYTDFVAIIPGNRAVVYAFIPEHMSMTNPLVSPLYSDQAGLGPQLIFAADTEGLLNDSRAFHQKCIAANVQAKLVIGRGQMHTYALVKYPLTPLTCLHIDYAREAS